MEQIGILSDIFHSSNNSIIFSGHKIAQQWWNHFFLYIMGEDNVPHPMLYIFN